MRPTPSFAALLERFFTQRLMAQRQASPHTIASYRDTFRLLLCFAEKRLRKPPSALALADLDASLVSAFLDDLEQNRGVIARTRTIPSKRYDRRLVGFLTREGIEALLDVPNVQTWDGRRDRAFVMMAIQTGLRLSELTGLKRCDVVLREGAHVSCVGKSRKERSTPLTSQMVGVLKTWLKEPIRGNLDLLFPNIHGGRMSADAVQHLVAKHVVVAQGRCPALRRKRVSPHVMRHYVASRTMSRIC